mgnify:CR=1 FL=1
MIVQAPVAALQQAPVAGGGGWSHGFGLQAPPGIQYVPVQLTWVVIVQSPFRKQHAPSGGGQSFGTQVPNIVQVPVQSAAGVTVQSPFGAQQAPVGSAHRLDRKSTRLNSSHTS